MTPLKTNHNHHQHQQHHKNNNNNNIQFTFKNSSYQFWLLCSFGFCFFALMLKSSEACSSRAIIKPRPTNLPPSSSTAAAGDGNGNGNGNGATTRPNITFPIFNCPPTYAAWYCLNDAICFTVEIHNEILYNCECANGFMGPRCEYKEIDGSYLPTRQRVMLEKASIASGFTLALVAIVIVFIIYCIKRENKQKKLNEISTNGHRVGGHENEGMDEVDGMTRVPEMRPFGPHHYKVQPLAYAFRR